MNVAFFLFMEASCFLLFVFLSSLVCLRRASPNIVAREGIIKRLIISGGRRVAILDFCVKASTCTNQYTLMETPCH